MEHQKTAPKTELLVFNKKEITVIIVLLVLVALFSFTLGLRLGKTLGGAQAHLTEVAPLDAHHEAVATEEAAKPEKPSEHTDSIDKNSKVEAAAPEHAQAAEDKADTEFAAESSKEKVKPTKPVPMALPNEKKRAGDGGPRYTLQVGSHRTIAEAAEQVSALKRSELDAFYLEARVPGKGTWYRVGIGLFASKEAAEHQGGKWKAIKKNMPSFIVQKISE